MVKAIRIICVLLLLGLWVTVHPVGASTNSGIVAEFYDVSGQSNAPVLPENAQPVCTLILDQITHDYDKDPLCGLTEDFIVNYKGWITSPIDSQIEFMPQADDGTRLYIDGVLLVDDWFDKGGGGSISASVDFKAGVSHQINLWYYENGGGAWIQLYWLNNNNWETVPVEAYSQESAVAPSPEPTVEPTPETSIVETPTPEQTPSEEPVAVPSDTPTETPTPDLTPTDAPAPDSTPIPLESPIQESVPPTVIEPTPLPAETINQAAEKPTEQQVLQEITQQVVSDALADGVLTDTERELVAEALVTEFDGEPITFEALLASGLDYEDLPPEQPITLENGVVLTASVADAIQIFQSAGELLSTVFGNPSKALKALANVGADMTPKERKIAQSTVISAVIVTQLAQVRRTK